MSTRLLAPALALWFCFVPQSIAAEPGSTAAMKAAVMDFKLIDEMRDCNGCELDIGRALKADVIGWVQKVSNLILNLNIEVTDVASGRTLYTKSVDLRSNSDKSWLRGVRYMVDSIAEKKQHVR